MLSNDSQNRKRITDDKRDSVHHIYFVHKKVYFFFTAFFLSTRGDRGVVFRSRSYHQDVRDLSKVRAHQNAALITEDMQNNTTCIMLITQVTLSAF